MLLLLLSVAGSVRLKVALAVAALEIKAHEQTVSCKKNKKKMSDKGDKRENSKPSFLSHRPSLNLHLRSFPAALVSVA